MTSCIHKMSDGRMETND